MTDTPRAVTVSRPLPSTSSPRNRARTRPGEERRGDSDMLRVAIIVGSTRPGRKGDAVARWVYEIANARGDAEFELVDIKECDNKAAGFVGYGGAGGTRAVENLRLVMGELMCRRRARTGRALALHRLR